MCGPLLLIVGIVEYIVEFGLPNLWLADELFLTGFEMEHVKFNGADHWMETPYLNRSLCSSRLAAERVLEPLTTIRIFFRTLSGSRLAAEEALLEPRGIFLANVGQTWTMPSWISRHRFCLHHRQSAHLQRRRLQWLHRAL